MISENVLYLKGMAGLSDEVLRGIEESVNPRDKLLEVILGECYRKIAVKVGQCYGVDRDDVYQELWCSTLECLRDHNNRDNGQNIPYFIQGVKWQVMGKLRRDYRHGKLNISNDDDSIIDLRWNRYSKIEDQIDLTTVGGKVKRMIEEKVGWRRLAKRLGVTPTASKRLIAYYRDKLGDELGEDKLRALALLDVEVEAKALADDDGDGEL